MRGLPSPILVDVRRKILLIAVVGAVVGIVIAALVWQLWWPSDQPPSGPPPAKRYGTSLGLSSDLYRLRGECQHPRELISRSRAYLCQFAGDRLLFVVYTPGLVRRLQETFAADDEFFKEFFENTHGDLRDLDPEGFRKFAWGLGQRGIVVGPNWMALSDEIVTAQAVRQAIGGELFTVDPSAPFPSPTKSQ